MFSCVSVNEPFITDEKQMLHVVLKQRTTVMKSVVLYIVFMKTKPFSRTGHITQVFKKSATRVQCIGNPFSVNTTIIN